MKRHFLTGHILTALNTAAAAVMDGINSVAGVWSEISLAEGEKESRYVFTKYGEYPVEMLINGRVQTVTQVIDREAAELIASNYQSLTGKLAMFFRGIPIYEGHADDPDWLKENPGHKPAAVGRIKDIAPGAEGIEVRTVFNSKGVALLSGEAPEYSGHSPRWRMREIPGRPGCYRPFMVWSDALTNSPNIADSVMTAINQSPTTAAGATGETEKPTDEMKLTAEALKALGFAPDAMPTADEISAAIVKMLGEKTTAETEKVTAVENLTAANTKVTRLETELSTLRESGVVTALNTAVAAGRITEADKPKWEKLLKADFETASGMLAELKPVDALNTANRLGNLGERRGEGAPVKGSAAAMQDAVHAYAKEKGIDVSNTAGWNRAWKECSEAKPELFARG
jgi:hypothetical protein